MLGRGSVGGLLIGFAVAVAGCGGSTNSEVRPAQPDTPLAQTSSEWIYATSAGQGTPSAECKQVEGALEREVGCLGAACQHALNLGNDWLARCTKVAPAGEAAVRKAMSAIERRKSEPGGDCVTESERLLRKSCGNESEKCEAEAQRWATRCAA